MMPLLQCILLSSLFSLFDPIHSHPLKRSIDDHLASEYYPPDEDGDTESVDVSYDMPKYRRKADDPIPIQTRGTIWKPRPKPTPKHNPYVETLYRDHVFQFIPPPPPRTGRRKRKLK